MSTFFDEIEVWRLTFSRKGVHGRFGWPAVKKSFLEVRVVQKHLFWRSARSKTIIHNCQPTLTQKSDFSATIVHTDQCSVCISVQYTDIRFRYKASETNTHTHMPHHTHTSLATPSQDARCGEADHRLMNRLSLPAGKGEERVRTHLLR